MNESEDGSVSPAGGRRVESSRLGWNGKSIERPSGSEPPGGRERVTTERSGRSRWVLQGCAIVLLGAAAVLIATFHRIPDPNHPADGPAHGQPGHVWDPKRCEHCPLTLDEAAKRDGFWRRAEVGSETSSEFPDGHPLKGHEDLFEGK